MQQAVAERVLNIDELALYLRVAKSSLYKLCQEGKIPGQKVGRVWRFRKQAIDSWLEQTPGLESNVGNRATSGSVEFAGKNYGKGDKKC